MKSLVRGILHYILFVLFGYTFGGIEGENLRSMDREEESKKVCKKKYHALYCMSHLFIKGQKIW